MRDATTSTTTWLGRLPEVINRATILRFLLSLAIATFLWGWVAQMTDPIDTRIYRELDIAVGPLDPSMIMVTTLPTATVNVEGPESELSQLNRVDLGVVIDTSTVEGPGEYQLPLLVNAPDSSANIQVEPAAVSVQIDELVNELMPLTTQDTSSEDDPRTVSNIVPEVSQVTVSGPSSAVDRVSEVTLPVTLDNRNETFTEVFTPYAIDQNGQRVSEVEVLPAQISTLVELESVGKAVSVIPVLSGVPAEGFAVQQRAAFPDMVIVDGPADVLESLLFVNTEPVDITGATESFSESVGLADLPDGVTVVDPPEGRVEVRIALADISSSEQVLTNLPVQAVNVPAGYAASVEPRTISLTVDGASTTLSAMESSDIQVVVDVEGLGPGTHELTPQVLLPQGVTWTETTPETVEVTVSEAADQPATPVAQGVGTSRDAASRPALVSTGRRRGETSLSPM